MQNGLSSAILNANRALKQSSLYQKFAKKHSLITHKNDFFLLPIADKNNYIKNTALSNCLGKKYPTFAYSSSGSSGSSTFWFRNKEQEIFGSKIHEMLFSKVFKIKKNEPSLAVICFSMGSWVAGNYTSACCQKVSELGYNLTTITPGIEKSEIIAILKKFAPEFKNLILAGYPSFIMDVLVETKKLKIQLPKSTKILTAGDSFSEEWRNSALTFLPKNSPPHSIISIYGSADAGLMGFETPLTIKLRRDSLKNPVLYKYLFGENRKQPALFQYDPTHIFFESINDELVLTTQAYIPLIRYNIHDWGKTIQYEDCVKTFKNIKPRTRDWRLPLITKSGRSDVAVTFYALNIYPENILAGLENSAIAKLVTTNFRAFNKIVKNHSEEQLWLEIETKNSSINAQKKIKKTILKKLLEFNTEFKKLHNTIGKKAIPHIKLVRHLSKANNSQTKLLLNIHGKKPKMLP